MTEHEIALRALSSALEDFLNSGFESEGSTDEHEHAGMDPYEVDFESIEKNGEIWKALVEIRPFYGKDILTFPNPRQLWKRLQRVCRYGPDDPFEHQNEAHDAAYSFQAWVIEEIDKINKGDEKFKFKKTLVARPKGIRPEAIVDSSSDWIHWEEAIYDTTECHRPGFGAKSAWNKHRAKLTEIAGVEGLDELKLIIKRVEFHRSNQSDT